MIQEASQVSDLQEQLETLKKKINDGLEKAQQNHSNQLDAFAVQAQQEKDQLTSRLESYQRSVDERERERKEEMEQRERLLKASVNVTVANLQREIEIVKASRSNPSSYGAADMANVNERVSRLERNQKLLIAAYVEEQRRLAAESAASSHPSLRKFFDVTRLKFLQVLEAYRLACMEMFELDITSLDDLSANVDMAVQSVGGGGGGSVLSFVEDSLRCVLPGGDLLISLFKWGLQKAFQRHMLQEAKKVSVSLLEAATKEVVAFDLAITLTSWYEDQVVKLTPKHAARLAECGVYRILEWIKDTQPNLSRDHHEDLVEALAWGTAHEECKKQGTAGILNMSVGKVNGSSWTDRGVFTGSGLKVKTRRTGGGTHQHFDYYHCVPSNNSEKKLLFHRADKYGYRHVVSIPASLALGKTTTPKKFTVAISNCQVGSSPHKFYDHQIPSHLQPEDIPSRSGSGSISNSSSASSFSPAAATQVGYVTEEVKLMKEQAETDKRMLQQKLEEQERRAEEQARELAELKEMMKQLAMNQKPE